MLRRVSGLYERFSTVIVDGGSRLESVMAACGIGAERLLCVTAADRISLAASYALFKVARGRFQSLPVQLVVNGSEHAEAQDLHDLVRSAARNFLSTDIRFGGAVPQDEKLHGLLRRGVSMTELDAESVALSAVEEMASRMLGERDSAGGRPPLPLIR